MSEIPYRAAAEITAWIALVRCAWVFLGFFRTWRIHRRARTIKVGWVELVALPEPFVLLITALLVRQGFSPPLETSAVTGAVALFGTCLSLGGLAVSLWSFHSFPTVGTGHYIASGQRLVTAGAYGVCRHPIYLGVVLIWLGLAASTFSGVALLIALGYVVPAYVLYMRSEEAMMRAAFGDEYESYCRKVNMLLPGFRG